MSYSVALEAFHGPLGLLLHLVKRSEVDVLDIPIAKIADQFLEYLNVMQAARRRSRGRFPRDGGHTHGDQEPDALAGGSDC